MIKEKKNGLRNQRTDVLEYLQLHGSITQLEAYYKFEAPITRLSAVIYDLRKAGYNIESGEVEGKNCYGKFKCARYYLR